MIRILATVLVTALIVQPSRVSSQEWADTVDAWAGLCTQAEALASAAELKMPCLVGPGAVRPPQLDSVVAGTGTLDVYRITDYSNTTGPGTLRAAVDSIAARDDGRTCSAIIFPVGGEVSMRNGGTQNADNSFNCVYILGQLTPGEGINIVGEDLRARYSDHIYAGYFSTRAPGAEEGFIFHSSSDMLGGSGHYIEHTSRSWYNGDSGINLIGIGCGTDVVVPDDPCRDFTVAYNLVAEPDSAHPTCINYTRSDPVGGVPFMGRIITYRNYAHSCGQRVPANLRGDSSQVLGNVAYNTSGYYAHAGNAEDDIGVLRFDYLDNYLREGPSSSSEWAIYFTGLPVGDEISIGMAGNRTVQNDYALGRGPASYVTGPERTVACDANVAAFTCASDGDAVPDSIVTDVTDTLDISPALGQPDIVPMTDSVAEFIVQIAGNSRGVDASGQWYLRSDSVDARYRQEWADSTGSGRLNMGTNRTFGVPASGTAYADTDLDGLPNEYEFREVGDSTGLAPDSIANGLPALLWYASGYSLDGEPIGCEGTCSVASSQSSIPPTDGTFNSDSTTARYVYFDATVTGSGFVLPTTIPRSLVRLSAVSPAQDTVLVVTCVNQGTPADSVEVEARLSAWSLSSFQDAVDVRDYQPPYGMEC